MTASLRPASLRPASLHRGLLRACTSRPVCPHTMSASPSSRVGLCTAYVALGSNMGDRVGNIERACAEMNRRGISVRRTSGLWETRPMYVEGQDMFVNGACEIETELQPIPLLDALQKIESDMGRVKIVDKGPRNIDLDILLYGDQRVDHPRLTVPHIGIREREFVLRPLAQLIPDHIFDDARPLESIQSRLDALSAETDPSEQEPMSTLTPLSDTSLTSSPNLDLRPLLPTRRTLVMSILNVTPDSFSDGGTHSADDRPTLAAAVSAMVAAGADMIDVGGQSTRPGADYLDAATELARVIPAIETIRSLPDPAAARIPISIDTFHAAVAEAAVAAGADVINDVSAGLMDPAMLPTAARLGKTIILNHTRGTPQTMARRQNTSYRPHGVVAAVAADLLARVRAAEAAGVPRWRIVLDPGLGFAKQGPDSLELLRRLDHLRRWPGLDALPFLVGPSRKKFVQTAAGARDALDSDYGTAGAVAAAVSGGADIVRVHNTAAMVQVVKISDMVWRKG